MFESAPTFLKIPVYLGLDLGQARCGLAVAARGEVTLALPLAVVATRPLDSLAQRILTALGGRLPVELVAGLPLDQRGLEGLAALSVRDLAVQLQAELSALLHSPAPLPLHFVDERFSTAAALIARREAAQTSGRRGRGKEKHIPLRRLRTDIDADVAAELLQTWLDTGRGPGATPLR
jgi:RNase H-fold protein (predicted Holliday junction resolvase)